jgi:hypothetical protein
MLLEVAGERPGADLLQAPRTVPLRWPWWVLPSRAVPMLVEGFLFAG